jgi:hypothetical protein
MLPQKGHAPEMVGREISPFYSAQESNGGGWVVLGRAIGVHVTEAACCFVLAKSTENPEKRMLAMQREQRALLEIQRFERIAALERRIFEHAFAAFDQVEQQLGGPVQVQALPAAGQMGEENVATLLTVMLALLDLVDLQLHQLVPA